MCTVTFIPTTSGCYITSNRDEHASRGEAIFPIKTNINGFEILFPKDPDAGGTWIATKNNGDVLVLLNGAFLMHALTPPYRKSRGIILLEMISAIDSINYFDGIDLHNIEPFTLIYFHDNRLSEYRWDGLIKYCKELNSKELQIWSSATLYNAEISLKRETWFKNWVANHSAFTQAHILDFHLNAGEGDSTIDILMSRNNGLSTVSISSLFLAENYTEFSYYDLKNNLSTREKLITNHVVY